MANATAGWLAAVGGAAAILGAYLANNWLGYGGGILALIGGIVALRS